MNDARPVTDSAPFDAAGRSPETLHAEYTQRLAERRDRVTRQAELERRLSRLRLAVFAIALGVSIAAFGARAVSGLWLLPLLAVFLVLVVAHDRVIRARVLAERAVAFYERGLARLENRFAGTGETGDAYDPEGHPYAADLDLFGRGSLYELLCDARTRAGEATLAAWLLAPAPPDEIRGRQGAVAELAPALDLREDLALLGSDARTGLHADALRTWGEAPPVPFAAALPWVAGLLSTLTIGALLAWALTGAGALPFVVALLVQSGFAGVLRSRVQQVVRGVDAPAEDLGLLAELLARVESEPFQSTRLEALRRQLETEGVPPSRRIAQLRRQRELLEARRNQFFAPIGGLLLWTTQLALAIERWRHACGARIGPWIDAVGEFETLSCLACLAFERPDTVFPEIVGGDPRFEAAQLAHPLLPADRCVRNDVGLGDGLQVLVVSGSNMSGKSTLLRSVGTAAVLAQAGAPVCASALRMTPLAIGASIRVQDSLQEGASRFYAEIQRLRQVMEIAEGSLPGLFLLDEILHGTNSHDRGIGAEAVVRGLRERGAIGLVTTHDLALTRVADALAPAAANVHFADHLEDGRMVFDYRMQPGVVTRSNALELMRAVGLDV